MTYSPRPEIDRAAGLWACWTSGRPTAGRFVGRCRAIARNARRGVTLIESVLYISIALGLIVGGLVVYQQASRAAQWQDVRRGLEVVNSELRALYQITRWHDQIGLWSEGAASGAGQSVNATLIAMAAVPAEMISGNDGSIVLAHGGNLVIRHVADPMNPSNIMVMFSISDVPLWLCTRMLPTPRRNQTDRTGDGIVPGISRIRIDAISQGSNLPVEFVVPVGERITHRMRNQGVIGAYENHDGTQSWGALTPELAAQHCRNMADAAPSGVIREISIFSSLSL